MIKSYRGNRREGKTTLLVKEICEFIDNSLTGDVLVVVPMGAMKTMIQKPLLEYYGKRIKSYTQSKIILWGDRDIDFFVPSGDVAKGKRYAMIGIDEAPYVKKEYIEALYAMTKQTDPDQEPVLWVETATHGENK